MRLGLSGMPYADIQKQYSVPKSTISVWMKNAGKVTDRTKQLEHLKKARVASARSKGLQKRLRQDSAEELAGESSVLFPVSDLSSAKSLLAMLYWAEGSKHEKSSGLKFVNTDPVLIKFYLDLVRNSFEIDEGRLRVGIHVHYYHDQETAITFWSDLTGVPRSQFWRIHVKKRSEQKKFRENFQGICTVYYGNRMIRDELLALGRLLAQKLSSFNG